MKKLTNWHIFLGMILLLTYPALAQTRYQLSSCKLVISGTSSLHNWESESTSATINGSFTITANEIKDISGLVVEIPVEKIKSPKGSMMDKKTYEALKSDQHPSIGYVLTKVNSITKKGNTYEANTTGNLTIAGSKRLVNMIVTGVLLPGGNIEWRGSLPIKMSDYNIEPPTALMGSIKTGNDVTVAFTVVMAPKNI